MRKKRILEICLNVMLLVVSIALVTPSILTLRPELTGADSSIIGWGKSMEPTLFHGDILFLKEPKGEIETGDIVTIEGKSPKIVVHRVINIVNNSTDNSTLFLTKGDANQFPDNWATTRFPDNWISKDTMKFLDSWTPEDMIKFPDSWASEDMIKGKVIHRIPTSLILTFPGFFFLIVLPLTGIAARMVYVSSKEIAGDEQKKGKEGLKTRLTAILNLTTVLLICIVITSSLMWIVSILRIYLYQDVLFIFNQVLQTENGILQIGKVGIGKVKLVALNEVSRQRRLKINQ